MPYQEYDIEIQHRWQGGRCVIKVIKLEDNSVDYVYTMASTDAQTKYYIKLLKKKENESRYNNKLYSKKIKKGIINYISAPGNLTPIPDAVLNKKINYKKYIKKKVKKTEINGNNNNNNNNKNQKLNGRKS